MERKLINKKEIWIIVLVLVVCALIFLYYGVNRDNNIAVITVDGNIYQEIDLKHESGEYVIDIIRGDKTAHIQVSNHKIGFVDYECPDGVCQNTGMISSPLQAAVCLPLKVSVTIKDSKSGIDAISG